MKLVIVTAVEEFFDEIHKIFKRAKIKNFSTVDINGFKDLKATDLPMNWFMTGPGTNESVMFFSFTEESYIDALFEEVEIFNQNLETNNPLKVVVLPIERYI